MILHIHIRIDLGSVAPVLRLLHKHVAARWNRFMERTLNPLAPSDMVLRYARRRADAERRCPPCNYNCHQGTNCPARSRPDNQAKGNAA